MAKGLEIGVGVDTKAAKQAIQSGLTDPLEDAEKALDELGDSKAPEELERELKAAQKATERLKDETEDTARAIEKEYKRAYREQKEAARDASRSSADATAEFKQEAVSNFSEVTSSFDGSMSSIQDLAQGTLGGLASSGIPGIGIAAGAAAIAVGGIAAAVESVDEAAKESAARAAEWGQKYIDAAGDVIDASVIASGVIDIANDPDAYKNATDLARIWGTDIPTAMRALAGDSTALAVATDTFAASNAENAEKLKSGASDAKNLWGEYAAEVKKGADEITKLNDEQAKGKDIAKNTSDALLAIVADAGTASKEVDALGNQLLTLEDGTQVFIDADTKQATTNLDRFQGDLDGVPETITTKVALETPDLSKTRSDIEKYFRNNPVIAPINGVVRYGRTGV